MFPTGWPGLALLLLRGALGVNLAHAVFDVEANGSIAWAAPALLVTVAIVLCLGLFTPVTAVLCALIEIVIWHFSSGAGAALHVCAIRWLSPWRCWVPAPIHWTRSCSDDVRSIFRPAMGQRAHESELCNRR